MCQLKAWAECIYTQAMMSMKTIEQVMQQDIVGNLKVETMW